MDASQVQPTKVVVAGAGSIGTVVGLLLQRQGHDVTLLRKRGRFGKYEIQVVGEDSFKIEMKVMDSKVGLPSDQKIQCDVIIIASQRQQLIQQLKDLNNLVNFSNKPIIFAVQNGLGTAELVCDWINEQHYQLPFVQGIIWWSATLQNDALVLYHSKSLTAIGIPKQSNCSLKLNSLSLIDQLLSPVLEVKKVDMDREPFIKLILNVVSPVLALVKQPYPTGLNDLSVRKSILLLFEEAINIGKFEGWYNGDTRIESFHELLKGKEQLNHYSIGAKLPVHKVSTQISTEKYGAKGSNLRELLTYFLQRDAIRITKLYKYFANLPPDYEKITGKEVLELLA